MSTWNTSYESQPGNSYNPGGGAQSIRTLKVDIRERGNRAHYWGGDEGTEAGELGGQHREGSARCFVLDDDESNRDEFATPDMSSEAIGVLRIDLSEIADGSKRQQDGDNLEDLASYTLQDQATKKIEVLGTSLVTGDVEVLTVFDYDAFVDIVQDQSIDGVKTYTLAPLSLEAVVIDDDYDGTDDADKLVRAEDINAFGLEAKYHNLFDPVDDDNLEQGLVNSDGYITETIKCTSVEAQILKGTVWV